MALHSTRLQAGESRHASSLPWGAGVRTAATAEGLGDAAEGVVGKVGLGRGGAAEAARGALLGGFEAFFDS